MTRITTALLSIFLLTAAIAAQTGPFKPAEVANLISFYEWALEVKFTAAQRTEFQGYMEEDYRNDSKTARSNTNSLLSTWTNLKRESKDVRDLTRAEFMKVYLPKLQKSTEPDHIFLLGVYESAHRSVEAGEKPVLSGSGSDAGLTGKWWRVTGTGSSGDGTGKTRYGSGTKYTFEFFGDGTVEYISEQDALSITQCKITETSKARGKVTVKGGSMTIDFGPTTTVGTNSCNVKGNFKRTVAASGLTVKYKIKREDSVFRPDAPLMLCFEGTGGEVCHEKDIPFNG